MDRVRAFVRGKDTASKAKETDATPRRVAPAARPPEKGTPYSRKPTFDRMLHDRARPSYSPYRPRGRGPPSYSDSFTPLVKTPSEILATERVKNSFPRPPPIKPGPKAQQNEYCEFHKGFGHKTDDCMYLKREIEAAVKTGRLAHLVKEIKEGGGDRKGRDAREPGRADVVMVRRRNEFDVTRSVKARILGSPNCMKTPILMPYLEEGEVQRLPLNISAVVAGHKVSRIHVDGGSGVEVIYEHCFLRFDRDIRDRLEEDSIPLVGFNNSVSHPLGKIRLPFTVGVGDRVWTINLTFTVVRAPSKYNAILGRPGIGDLQAQASTPHGALVFQTPKGLAWVKSAYEVVSSVSKGEEPGRSQERKVEEWVLCDKFPEQTVKVGSHLSDKCKSALKELLLHNLDVFAFQHGDMTGIPRSLTEHRLNTFTWAKPVKQKKRSMGPNKRRAACEETRKLLRAGIVREVKYPSWVANPVMVQKKDGGWRMCIDFQDLNKACPKDCYPLPEIDTQVDSLSQYPLKCFLDAYKGYHQIQMSIEDEEKTAFIIDEGTFCYTKMPFGLKNAGATYQWFMNTLFREQRGRNLEVYVDDIVIKSLTEVAMIDDIAETLNTMQDVNMKLNPGKCCFGVEEGNFLGVVVTKGGIKANPEKTQAVAEMRSPRSLKDIQQLNGRLIALNRFLSKVADKTLPFMKVLKDCLQTSKFNWTTEAKAAFQEMKTYICKLPTLATPMPGDPLLLYLSASKTTISAVMMVEREGKQIHIYFISRTLKGPEERYMPLEKLALALVFASRRLRRYFQGHKVTLVTDQPLQKVLRKPELSGRLAKWAVELGEHSLEFKHGTAMKGQILADFLAEVPEDEERELLKWEALEEEERKREDEAVWKLFTDGASSEEGSGAGITLVGPEGVGLTYAIRLDFENTNNTAEYEALLVGMRLAQKMKAKHVEASTDSQLVVKQYQGEYEAKDSTMAQYVAKVKEAAKAFRTFKLEYIPRGRNRKSDALSKLASVAFDHLAKEVKVEVLTSSSLNTAEVATVEGPQETWMTPIIKFLRDGTLPEGEWAARKIRVRALQYELIEGELYRRSYLGLSLKCVDMEEAEYVIREMHEGICGMHSGPRTVVRRAMNAGFYWPRMYETTSEEIKKCVPSTCTDDPPAQTPHGASLDILAIPEMGHRHSWAFPGGSGRGQIRGGSH
ncbi:uncharacterized protein LOC110932090 [Helianthus annuus]|uniref:uncharacterized protein LOC110932090 n=1 Tax=Helianthus annuus TaxID=4232 RepID=UPI000B8F329A|nr:uncharacterized protein LOC110932090 [Helianthus annuus]